MYIHYTAFKELLISGFGIPKLSGDKKHHPTTVHHEGSVKL